MTETGLPGFAERVVALPGVRLWYRDSAKDGVPLFLLHAATGNADAWRFQMQPFSEAGYRVIAFDRRGWGRSVADPATGPQPGTLAEDLDALADALGIGRFHLLGMAAGGHAALDYAAWRGDRLMSLTLAATTCLMQEPDFLAFLARIDIPGLHDLPASYREIGASFRGAQPDLVLEWMEIESRSRQRGAAVQLPRVPNTYAKAASVRAPTLVVVPGADIICPPALMAMWYRHLPSYEWRMIPDAGHAPQWERPDAFNALVLDFLGRHRDRGSAEV